MLIAVNEMFYTIQGEATHTGKPSVFIRLQGCKVGCPWCFADGTKVLMADFTQKAIEDVKVGEQVLSYNSKKREYIVSNVVDVTSHEENTLELVTRSGKKVVCTDEHIFHTNKRKSRVSVRKKPAKEMAGMAAVTTPTYDISSPHISEGFMRGYLMGAMAGDGSTSMYNGCLKFHWQVCDIEFAERISDFVNYFGRDTYVREAKRKTVTGKTVYRVDLIARDLNWILNYPDTLEETRGYISGFFDAEGTVGSGLSFSQKDEKTISRVKTMLDAHGFCSVLKDYSAKHDIYNLFLKGGKPEISRFFDYFDTAITRKSKKIRQRIKHTLNSDIVESVQRIGIKKVFNLMTTKGNFFANQMLVDQCDTKNTWGLETGYELPPAELIAKTSDQPSFAWFHVEQLVKEVEKMGHENCHVVITGGEPLEQEIEELVTQLISARHTVQIETSGTVRIPTWTVSNKPMPWVTLSPKIGMPGGKEVNPVDLLLVDEIKFPVGKAADIEILKTFIGYKSKDEPGAQPKGGIWLQPLSQNPKSTQVCVNACKEYGWRLSLQTHKYAGLR